MVTRLEPDILVCEVKWVLGNITKLVDSVWITLLPGLILIYPANSYLSFKTQLSLSSLYLVAIKQY